MSRRPFHCIVEDCERYANKAGNLCTRHWIQRHKSDRDPTDADAVNAPRLRPSHEHVAAVGILAGRWPEGWTR